MTGGEVVPVSGERRRRSDLPVLDVTSRQTQRAPLSLHSIDRKYTIQYI